MTEPLFMTPMESLLSAIDDAKPIYLPNPHNKKKRNRSPTPQQMSIESILDHTSYKRHQPYYPISPPPQSPPHSSYDKTIVTCYHASVAQKSYGTEKRFLCPPPIVMMSNPVHHQPVVSMTVVCETGDRQLEQRTLLDEQLKGSFKYLFVTGTAKAKQFCLRVNLSHQQQQQQHYASFFSHPISIISKPSKKTAKARNVSTCLFTNSHVSLFNRINSQTVRTKYLTTDNKQLCAKHASWSPFEIIVVRQPNQAINPDNHSVSVPITYGTEIILKDVQTAVSSPPLIIRKVDKGQVVHHAYGLLSQMQKIALQLSSSVNQEPLYLNANGQAMSPQETDHSSHNINAWIDFMPSKHTRQNEEEVELVNDYLCWTIVGISRFEYAFSDTPQPISRQPSPPPSPPRSIVPYPVLQSVDYLDTHTLRLTGQHLTASLEYWLGSHGPFKAVESHDQLLIQLPSNLSKQRPLPLFIVRHDGFIYHSTKSLCFQSKHWFILDSPTQ
ncbi:beta-trefoil DNA-binding domain-containing protein [Choanephora cucurbitarum]|nr:beta-trefoil DNA-binding domain-containing protein [Choanephora cucurbitarum]